MSQAANQKISIYSISDIHPLFEHMHNQIGLSSERFKEQNKIARTIWLAMRIDGEIKNGGIEQLFSNLGEGLDTACFVETLKNIDSKEGLKLVQEFIDFIHQTPEHKSSFYGENSSISGFYSKLKKLHNDLSDQYYKLDPSVEALIVAYAEANWNDPEFQESIKDVVFQTGEKDESELIGSLNDALKSGNVVTTRKILKNLKNINQGCKYGFVPMLELPYVPNPEKRIELCQLLLDHGADIHVRDKYHNTVLHKAAGAGKNESFIEFLLNNGADIEIKDDYENTPVFSTDTTPENAKILIQRGANLNIKNKIGFSPLTKIFNNYHGWYGNPHAKNYQPKIKKTIDLFLAAGSVFNSNILLHGNTELSMFVEDPKMLKYLLKQKTVTHAPEFNPEHAGWSAVFQASLEGNTESLQLLADRGAFLNQTLGSAHYETKTFAGATPLNVAKNQETKEFLQQHGTSTGTRKAHALFLETRGNNQESVLLLISKLKEVDEKEAQKLFNTVKKKMDEGYERIDGNFVIYKPLFLAASGNEEEIRKIESDLEEFGSEYTLI